MAAKYLRGKGKKTLILFGIFLALLAFVYFYEIKGGAQREAREKSSNQLFPTERDNVRRLELITAKDSIVCERKGNAWVITAPVQTEGDSALINSYLGSILESSIERKVLDTLDAPEVYGLQTPRCKVRLTTRANQVFTLAIGDENPTGSALYVKYPEKPAVYTTSTSLWTYASKSLYDLRDKRTMHINVNEVRKIEIHSRKKGTVKLEKVGNDWQITSPVLLAANNSEVQSLLNRLANGRVKNFISETPERSAKYGFAKPQLQIVLYLGESLAKTSFTVGDTARDDGGGFYAYEESRAPVFTIENWAKDNLIKGAFELQNKKLLDFTPESPDRIVWRLENREYAAIKIDTTNWLIVLPDTVQVDNSHMNRWLEALGNFSADELESYQPKSLANYGLDLPRLQITVFKKDQQLGTILVGKETKENFYTKAGSAPYIYKIRKYSYQRIAKTPDDLRVNTPEKK